MVGRQVLDRENVGQFDRDHPHPKETSDLDDMRGLITQVERIDTPLDRALPSGTRLKKTSFDGSLIAFLA